MLCDRCGELVRPVVALDIDGTLGDYHGHFLKFAGEYLAYDPGPFQYQGRPSFKQWFCQVYGVDEDTWRHIKLAYRQGAQKRSMPAYPGVKVLSQLLQDAGVDVWLTTTRPYLRLDTIDPDTRFWLSRFDVQYKGLLYDEAKYAQLAERVDPQRVVAVLDDEVEQWQAAGVVFGWRVPILRRNPYNTAVAFDGPETLDEAAVLIMERLNEWRTTHGTE